MGSKIINKMTSIPNNRKIDAEGSRQVKGVDAGVGDVTQAGTNAFTGSNSFATPPTSAQDADSANELVRFSQLTGLVSQAIDSFTPTLTDSGGGATYSISGNAGQIYTIGDLVIVYISMNVASTSGLPTGHLEFGGIPGSYTIEGIPGGSLRFFRGSGLSNEDVSLLYPNNVDSPLTKITLRSKITALPVEEITFTSGAIELYYQFKKA
jgi:hypothetical protein